jgi:PPOX class probable FMN-dependent enzyme
MPVNISSETALRAVIGDAHPITVDKELDHLDVHALHFIELSPFLCIGTTNSEGRADVSPRGDPPGFVTVLDDRTLLIPERPGNRRADTMLNVMAEPVVGLIFFLPGVEETLRISGHATVIDDPAAMADLAVQGKTPKVGIRVGIDQVFFHCAKALKRSRLWDHTTQIERAAFPTHGQIIRDQQQTRESAAEIDVLVKEDEEKNLY